MVPLLSFILTLVLPASAGACTMGSAECGVGAVLGQYQTQGALSGTLLMRHAGREFGWSFQLANDATREPNRAGTVFCLASISKSFVAASILKLVEEGKIDIDDTLHSFIPEYPRRHLRGRNGLEVTLFHLLTHTSGVPEAYDTKWVEKRIDKQLLDFEQMIFPIKRHRLEFSPGSQFEYSNTGYLLLGEVVHRASGMPYAEFLRKNFLEPLGLNHTSVGPPSNPDLSVARLYEREPSGERMDYEEEYGLTSLAASPVYTDTNIYSDAGDLANWIQKLTGGEVLSAESTRELLTPHLDGYGFGLFIYNDAQGRLAYEHAGDYDGAQSWARRYPDQDLTTIWVGNEALSDSDLDQFYEAINSAALESTW